MQVIGSSSEARSLSLRLKNNVKSIKDLSCEEEMELSRLQLTFRDEGFDDMSMIVKEILQTLYDSLEDVAGVCLALNKYADILEENN